MNRSRPLLLLLGCLLLAACAPRAVPAPGGAAGPVTAPPVASSAGLCAYTWDTRALPELSARLQGLVDASGWNGVTAGANAYGEDCTDPTGKLVSFGAMETDFHFTVTVASLKNTARMGEILAGLLKIVRTIPTEALSGPMPGYVGVAFESGQDQLNLWFPLKDGLDALDRGLKGAELFEALHSP